MADYTILIVDYEPRSLELARAPLAAAGFKIETAADGVAAIEAFQRIKPDLVLIEAMLPKKHGFEVCQTIKKSPEGKRTPVLITTGVYKGRKYRTQALHIYGCDEYIEKPVAPETLVELCRRFLKGGPVAPGKGEASMDPGPVAASDSPSPVLVTAKPRLMPSPKPPAVQAARESGASAAASIVSGLTEDEIMARLDAILPDDGMRMPSYVSTSAVPELEPMVSTAVACPEEAPAEAAAPVSEPELVASEIPISQPDPVDTVLSPTVPPLTPVPTSEGEDPHVVQFDATRARKRRRSKPATSPSDGVAAPATVAQDAPAPRESRNEPLVETLPLPTDSVEAGGGARKTPDAEPVVADTRPYPARRPQKTRVPLWVWAAVVGVVALGALYLIGGTSGRGEASRPVAGSEVAKVATPTPKERGRTSASPTSSLPATTSVDARRTAPPPSPTEADRAANASTRPKMAPPQAEETPATRGTPVRSDKAPVTASQPASPQSAARRPETPPSSIPAPSKIQAATPAETQRTVPLATGAQSPSADAKNVAPAAAAAAVPQSPPAAVEGSTGLPKPSPTVPADTEAKATQTTAEPAVAAPPKKAAVSGTPMNLYEVDKPPVPMSRPAPPYTDRAKSLRQRGSVFLNLLVDETGKVTDVQLIQGIPDSDLNEVAIRTAHTWVYVPAIKDGAPVKVWKFEKINFEP